MTIAGQDYGFRSFRSYPGSWCFDGVALAVPAALRLLEQLKAAEYDLDHQWTDRFWHVWRHIGAAQASA